ncbi:S49 family peptidase [Comamonas thiooxydans]|uniref:S49 family peptidase n=1 Tax=Comamonas thiooxydans TaxID=363952 RepID=UPI000B41BD38|nr:S49 family peptidase [Comamonas thiooxydans]
MNHPVDATIDSAALIDELLKHRKADRRAGLIKTGVIALGFAAYAAATYFVLSPTLSVPPTEPYAAVIPVNGVIADGKPASYEHIAPLLKQAFKDDLVKGVVLRINSPGGTPVQSSLIHDLVLELKKEHSKPVLAVGEDYMTSGAYFIASAADNLVVNRSTVTGSIGVISAGFGFQDVLAKLGIERRVSTAGNSKNLGDSFIPETEASLAKKHELLTDIHKHFIDAVVAGRGDRLKQDTPGLFEGNVWTGEKALAAGLVDGLGSVDNSVEKFLGVKKTMTLYRKRPLMDSILDSVALKAGALIAGQAEHPQLLPE